MNSSYIVGLYRGPGDGSLNNIDKFRCCKMGLGKNPVCKEIKLVYNKGIRHMLMNCTACFRKSNGVHIKFKIQLIVSVKINDIRQLFI